MRMSKSFSLPALLIVSMIYTGDRARSCTAPDFGDLRGPTAITSECFDDEECEIFAVLRSCEHWQCDPYEACGIGAGSTQKCILSENCGLYTPCRDLWCT